MYGDATWNKKEAHRVCRPLLHAYAIRFAHPASRELIHVQAPLPKDIMQIGAEVAGCSEGEFESWLGANVERRLAYSLKRFVFLNDAAVLALRWCRVSYN